MGAELGSVGVSARPACFPLSSSLFVGRNRFPVILICCNCPVPRLQNWWNVTPNESSSCAFRQLQFHRNDQCSQLLSDSSRSWLKKSLLRFNCKPLGDKKYISKLRVGFFQQCLLGGSTCKWARRERRFS